MSPANESRPAGNRAASENVNDDAPTVLPASHVVGMLLNVVTATSTPVEALAAVAMALGLAKKDLLVLDAGNDPFNAGTPADVAMAEWVVALVARHPAQQTHLRRLHYRALDDGVPLPNGDPYLNTTRCWTWLQKAAGKARHLGMLPRGAVQDRRSRDWQMAEPPEGPSSKWPQVWPPEVEADELDITTPTVQVREPYVMGYGYDHLDDIRIAVVVEKSTVDDVLAPLCRRLAVDFLSGQGYISHTRAWEWLRADTSRPARLLYISDFDPAGAAMPVAAARLLEFCKSEGPEDVALNPLALTFEQVTRYSLPTIPLDMGVDAALAAKRQKFLDRHDVAGAVELDALVARHPGVLQALVRDAVVSLRDDTLPSRLRDARKDALDAVAEVWDAHDPLTHHLVADVNLALEQAADTFRENVALIQRGITMQWLAARARAAAQAIKQVEIPGRPELDRVDEEHGWLYRSDRGYLDQLAHYRGLS